MFSFFRHIKALCCAMLASMMMASCDSSVPMSQEPDESAGLFLVCKVGMVGETRAGQTPVNEGMHTLRLVVMDIDRSEVEYNRLVVFDNVRENYSFVAEIKEGAYKPGGSHKRVFLISNEESVTNVQSDNSALSLPGSLHSILESVQVGDKDFESKINSVYYVPDFTKNIPLTSVYDITIPDGIRYVEESFWLVRVATKFSVVFENANLGIGVSVSSAKITGLSDRHFLMPRFTNGVAPTFAGYDTWIDWLKNVSDLSQADPYNPTADASGWLYGYEIPSTAAAAELNCISSPFTLAAATATNTPSRTVSNLYAAESRNRIVGSSIGEQRYTFVMTATSGSKPKTFTTALPNVSALFR
ncbi:MAG: hypothetical protein K2M98_00735, partial [Muribaculum sp.]|nr:hypothetical protein [Muribaculum sp.]